MWYRVYIRDFPWWGTLGSGYIPTNSPDQASTASTKVLEYPEDDSAASWTDASWGHELLWFLRGKIEKDPRSVLFLAENETWISDTSRDVTQEIERFPWEVSVFSAFSRDEISLCFFEIDESLQISNGSLSLKKPLKIYHPKRKVVFQLAFFMVFVKLGGGVWWFFVGFHVVGPLRNLHEPSRYHLWGHFQRYSRRGFGHYWCCTHHQHGLTLQLSLPVNILPWRACQKNTDEQ